MGLPGVLEVIIGLVFIYFLVSVLCSGLNEMIAHHVGRRGEFLREAIGFEFSLGVLGFRSFAFSRQAFSLLREPFQCAFKLPRNLT